MGGSRFAYCSGGDIFRGAATWLRHRLAFAWLLLFLGGLSLLLGFLQMAQGPGSGLRFYDVTNPKEAVGLLANRDHFAAHLYVTLGSCCCLVCDGRS